VGISNIELQECDRIIQNYMITKKQAEFGPIKEAGEKFLADNVKKPTVHVTPSAYNMR
jgi:hypothetical protein